MKILRKYATMALLLFSVAAIVPVYGNLEDEYVILKKRIIQQSNRPEVLKKVFQVGETAFLVVGIIGIIGYGAIGVALVYRHLTGGKYPIIKVYGRQNTRPAVINLQE
jgi:hypothetical protein